MLTWVYGCELRLIPSARSLSRTIARRCTGGSVTRAESAAAARGTTSAAGTTSGASELPDTENPPRRAARRSAVSRAAAGWPGSAEMEVITEISLGQSVVSVRHTLDCSMLGVLLPARLTMAR